MLNRVDVQQALRGDSWLTASATLSELAQAVDSESESWRLGAMAACAQAIGLGGATRDSMAQMREMIRLADGHLVYGAPLLQIFQGQSYTDFAITKRADSSVHVTLELDPGHAVFDEIPGLQQALRVDPNSRRNVRMESASAFLLRLSPHTHFASDGQKSAMHALMTMPGGATLVASLPTGWGKSALFQVGARRWREDDPTACVVVIVPTVALAQDHARSLSSMPGLEGSRALVGGMNASDRHQTLSAFAVGDVPILLMSPEMALGSALGALKEAAIRAHSGLPGSHLAAFVVDEAHVIASWGRYFRPDFQRLPGLVNELRVHQPSLRTVLLSATIDETLRKRFVGEFGGAGATGEVVVAEPRGEFDLVWPQIPSEVERMSLVVRAVDLIPRPAIIYTTTVKDAELIHGKLRHRGYRRLALFTGEICDPVERQQILNAWGNGDVDLVIATSAFGMGVDKPNVRAVVHACLPESADRFYQEIGRGGRDGHQALSLCLWTKGDAYTAAALSIKGWMLPQTSIKRWKAILREARVHRLFTPGSDGSLQMRVALDARHDDLGEITGQLNRQWNAALLTLLQRSGALQIVVAGTATAEGEQWVADILQAEVVNDGPGIDAAMEPYLSVGEAEAKNARKRARELERCLLNESERCLREALFDLVDPAGSPWPCGRCNVCIATGELPRSEPDRHHLDTAWSAQPWALSCRHSGGAQVVNLEDRTFTTNLDRLLAQLSIDGIQQFVTTAETSLAVEQAVASSKMDLGFTILLGGSVPPSRMPTAVLLGGNLQNPETVRNECIALRLKFEKHWGELPLIFVLSADIHRLDVNFSQYISSQAPVSEKSLYHIARKL